MLKFCYFSVNSVTAFYLDGKIQIVFSQASFVSETTTYYLATRLKQHATVLHNRDFPDIRHALFLLKKTYMRTIFSATFRMF